MSEYMHVRDDADWTKGWSLAYAGIPRRRHGHRHRLAKHGYNLTPDTCYLLARPGEEIACVGRKIVAVFGESVSVSVSVSWNASYKLCLVFFGAYTVG